MNLKYESALNQLISDFSGMKVLFYGTYMSHESKDDGLTLVPSRVRIIRIEKLAQ